MRKAVLSVTVLLLAAGIASGAWVIGSYPGVVGSWQMKFQHDWFIKIRPIIVEPYESGSSVTALITWTIVAWGTEITPNLMGSKTVVELQENTAEWIWDEAPDQAPLDSSMAGLATVTHTRDGTARVNHYTGEKYHGDYRVEIKKIIWTLGGIDADEDPVTGSGTFPAGLLATDWVHAPKPGSLTDTMPHASQAAPAPAPFELKCTPDANRLIHAVAVITAEARGSFNAQTALTNPRSMVSGPQPFNGATYLCGASVKITH